MGAPILLGSIGGTGGKLVVDYILYSMGDLKRPSELTMPSFAIWSGFLGTTIFYVTVHVLPLGLRLEQEQVGMIRHCIAEILSTLLEGSESFDMQDAFVQLRAVFESLDMQSRQLCILSKAELTKYSLTHSRHPCGRIQGKALVISFLLIQAMLSLFLGREVDITGDP